MFCVSKESLFEHHFYVDRCPSVLTEEKRQHEYKEKVNIFHTSMRGYTKDFVAYFINSPLYNISYKIVNISYIWRFLLCATARNDPKVSYRRWSIKRIEYIRLIVNESLSVRALKGQLARYRPPLIVGRRRNLPSFVVSSDV